MPTTRKRGGNDASGSKPASGARMPSGTASPTILGDHPPLVAHVNQCDECLLWVTTYMANSIVVLRQRGKRA